MTGVVDDVVNRQKEMLVAELLDQAEFLVDLRKSAPKAVTEFHQFVFEVVKKAILADGVISPAEAAWLEKFILADGKVDDMEKVFVRDLKASAKKTCPEFDALMKKHVGT